MEEKFKEYGKNIPEIITPSYTMEEPNQAIQVFEGKFTLKQSDNFIDLEGVIYFDWFPHTGVKFRGKVTDSSESIFQLTNSNEQFELFIDGLLFGEIYIQNNSYGEEIFIEGITLRDTVKGDRSIPVNKVRFVIPNLREFFGAPVRITGKNGGFSVSNSRVIFENDTYLITIDKFKNFKNLYTALSSKGGYIILYSGELVKKQNDIRYDELENIILSFSAFLSFLNGRRCAPHFIQGIYNDQVIWTDFSGYNTDQYKTVVSWPAKLSVKGLNELWNAYSKLWKDPNDKDFISSAIHWYLEANSNSGYLEGSIVMAQIALELIYNWFIIEKRKLLIGKDSENISASNKMRLLLSQVKGNSNVPDAFKHLHGFVIANKEIADGVEALVEIRNGIIHSQEKKRKKLTTMHYRIKYEAQQLALGYIEISLLYILDYKGKYFNRCSGKKWAGEGEEIKPE